ncbi:hypothetical protein GQ602_000825 [Ophiocordyceps camponoti-floridani]|uniref:Uncharacterized protein n=1 Tax=Ophiocordyceps camponoti-floridani TaxID=2030778 RepID=A0A8H4VGI2_9HYPO|nr:hypothetical protein GQ602_000825 [Ophiocordyceps camponoti-floridani]
MPPKSGSGSKNKSWKMSLDAPHQILDPAGYPKYTAQDQPLENQAQFAQFYPNGLPVTYHMVHGQDSSGVSQEYVENHLPVRFYTHPPAHAMGKFSTMYGQLKQFGIIGDLLPDRRVHLWTKDEIQSVCNSLRKVFWEDMKKLRRPGSWNDLWEFFDAVDMYHYGALNLWNVMNTLFDENSIITSVWRSELSVEIGHFADEWLKEGGNKDKLKDWDDLKGPVLCCLTPEDWRKVRNLKGDEISLLKSALEFRRDALLSSNAQQGTKGPADLLSAYQNNSLVNWLADAQVLSQNGLPPGPNSAPLSSMNVLAPSFVQQGRANSDSGQGAGTSAVQALQKSAGTSTTRRVGRNGDVVIAMGSSKLPPGWEETKAKDSSASDDVFHQQLNESKPGASKEVKQEHSTRKTAVADSTLAPDEAPEKKASTKGETKPPAVSDNSVAPVAETQDLASASGAGSVRVEEEKLERQGRESQTTNQSLGDQPVKLPRQKQRDGQRYHTSSSNATQGRGGGASRGPAQLPPRPLPLPSASGTQRNYTAPAGQQRGPRADATSPKGSNWNGGRGKGRGRGNSSYGGQQPGRNNNNNNNNDMGFDALYDQPAGWKDSWRRPVNEPHAHPPLPLGGPECRNDIRGGNFAYRPCSCNRCNEKNKSVWVTVHERAEIHPADVGARLRHGLAARFGDVEAVMPMNCFDGVAFVVRFRSESSVPPALDFGSGLIPEKQLSLVINAVQGSKWFNSTWQNPMPMPLEQSRMPPVSPYPGCPPPLSPFGAFPMTEHGAPSPIYPVVHGPGPMNVPVGVPPHLIGFNTSMMPPPIPRHQHQHVSNSSKNSFSSIEMPPLEELRRIRNEVTQQLAVDEAVQTKPPSEEALGSREKPASPEKRQERGFKTHEARVSLPTSSPPKMVQRPSEAIEAIVVSPAKPVQEAVKETTAEKNDQVDKTETMDKADKADKTEKAVDMDKTDKMDKADETEKTGEKTTVAKNQQREVAAVKDQNKVGQVEVTTAKHETAVAKDGAMATGEKTTMIEAPPADKGKAAKPRTPSLFTEEQIEGRLRAWDRIPMPLQPQKTKKQGDGETAKSTSDGEQKPTGKAAAENQAAKMKEGASGESANKQSTLKAPVEAKSHGRTSSIRPSDDNAADAGRETARKTRKKKAKNSRGTLPAVWVPEGASSTPSSPKRPVQDSSGRQTPNDDANNKERAGNGSRRGYRADAGGSLRQEKKRRGGNAQGNLQANDENGTDSSPSYVGDGGLGEQPGGAGGQGGGRVGGGGVRSALNPLAREFGAGDEV